MLVRDQENRPFISLHTSLSAPVQPSLPAWPAETWYHPIPFSAAQSICNNQYRGYYIAAFSATVEIVSLSLKVKKLTIF
jgi:hypothetical protein